MKNASSPNTGKKSRSWCVPESEITNPRIWSLIDPCECYLDNTLMLRSINRIKDKIREMLSSFYWTAAQCSLPDGMKKGARIIAGGCFKWSGSSSGRGPRQDKNYFDLGHTGPLQSRIESWIIEIDRAHKWNSFFISRRSPTRCLAGVYMILDHLDASEVGYRLDLRRFWELNTKLDTKKSIIYYIVSIVVNGTPDCNQWKPPSSNSDTG